MTNMTFRELLAASGMTIKQFSEHLGIPVRTVENWSMKSDISRRQCPEYVIELIRYRLTAEGIIE